MRAADIQYYTPPDVPLPRVQLELPYNRSMRTVLEVSAFPPSLPPSLPPSPPLSFLPLSQRFKSMDGRWGYGVEP